MSIPDGNYFIRNASSKTVLTVGVVQANDQYPGMVGSSLRYDLIDRQLFAVKQVRSGQYSITQVSTKHVADLKGSKPDNNVPIITYPFNDTPNQLWTPKAIDGGFQLQNVSSKKFMDLQASGTADGTPIINYQETRNPNQTWQFKKVGN
ncbi:ricin B lectin domain-containing protein [Geopyxis carbonaria]|nr:ricin B lectin domain-containing protein [Geopyxis carbonaria]